MGQDRRYVFRGYADKDREGCLALFDANCPEYFAPAERIDYEAFLTPEPPGYELAVAGDEIVGACGVEVGADESRGRIGWILIDPTVQGAGLGSEMLARARRGAEAKGIAVLEIAASHRSAPFFARFGAVELKTVPNGWGPGMHRIDMEWRIGAGP